MTNWQRIDSGLYTAHVRNVWFLDVRASSEQPGKWKWTVNFRPRANQYTGHAETKEEAMEICEQHLGE
jgi:hypothetical protein